MMGGWGDDGGVVLVFGASKGRSWWFSGIPCVLRTRPLRCAKGRFGGVLCFFWVPASAGMTG